MSDYIVGRKYDTSNGFKADIRYTVNGYLCGHVNSECGFITLHWSLDGFVMGADQGFDLIHPDSMNLASATEGEHYYLKAGEIVQAGDEADVCNDGWRDDPNTTGGRE